MLLRVKVNSYFHKIFCVFLVIRNKTSTSAFYVNNNSTKEYFFGIV